MSIVERIFVAPVARGRVTPVEEVHALDTGLEGDRYALQIGSFSRWPGAGRAVSLIEAEALDAIFAETGLDLRDNAARRNIVTRGITLPSLIGKTFRIGHAVFRGDRLCLPCRHVERLTQPGVYDALKGRGGLRADVVKAGIIRVGDTLEVLLAKA